LKITRIVESLEWQQFAIKKIDKRFVLVINGNSMPYG
jgi:hypothetical protein